MGGNELEVLKHYNRKIEKYREDVEILLNCLAKLDKVRVNISLLQDTNIGRTVSGLKKQYGDAEVGVRARDLVLKWKAVVAKEEREREEEEEEEAAVEEDVNEYNQEPCEEKRNVSSEPPVYIPTPIAPKYVPTPIDQLRIKAEPAAYRGEQSESLAAASSEADTEEDEPRQEEEEEAAQAEEEDEEELAPTQPFQRNHHHQSAIKKERDPDDDTALSHHSQQHHQQRDKDRREKKHKHKEKDREAAAAVSRDKDRRSSHHKSSSSSSKKSHKEREDRGPQEKQEEADKRLGSLGTAADTIRKQDSTRQGHPHSSRTASSSSSSGGLGKEQQDPKRIKSEHRGDAERVEADQSRSGGRSRDSAAAAATTTTHCDDIRNRSSSSSSTKERSGRREAGAKVKVEPPDFHPHEELSGLKKVKEEKQEISVRIKEEAATKETAVKVKVEPCENGHAHKHKEKHRDREKDRSKEREKMKERPERDKERDRDKEKKNEKEKEKKKKIKVEAPEVDLFARAMSGLGDGGEEEDSSTSGVGSGRTGSRKRPRETTGADADEYDSEGRVKERRVGSRENGGSSSSSSNGVVRPDLENKFRIPSPPRNLPGASYTPSTAFMPEISPVYKPLPRPPMESRHGQSEEEALGFLMGQKNKNRSAVYSGKKRTRYFQAVPTLFEQCIMVLQDHVEDIDEVGDLNFAVLRPVLERAPPKTLMHIEDTNPHLMEDTSELWEKHCNKDFRNKQREEMESWREMYERCTSEREEKLDQLKGKVKKTYLLEENSRRQTKIAYPDMVAKPPRDIARKQARFGTGLPVGHTMKAGPGPGGSSGSGSVKPRVLDPTAGARPPAPSKKPKQPPMMAKVKNMMKGLTGKGFGRR